MQLIQIAPGGPRTVRGPALGSKARPVSVSQLKKFLQCGYAWHARYQLGQPSHTTDALATGRALHDTARAWYLANQASETPPDADMARAMFARLLEAELSKFDSDDEKIRANAGRIFNHWLADIAPTVTAAFFEQPIEGEIGGVHVVGILDMLEEDGTLSDLKTKQKKQSSIDQGDLLQLTLYAELIGCSRVRVDYVAPTGVTRFPLTLTEDDKRFVRRLVPAACEAMQTGLYLPNRNHFLCSHRWCSHASECEREWGGSVKP